MFTVAIDTREKEGIWNFSFAQECLGHERKTIKTGDYTLIGYEDQLTIERKKTVGEISINLGSNWKTFQKELERMKSYKYRYIICEFSMDDGLAFPVGSGIPKYRWKYLRMSGKFIISRLNKIQEDYGITIIFCGNKSQAEQEVLGIFLNVISASLSRRFKLARN